MSDPMKECPRMFAATRIGEGINEGCRLERELADAIREMEAARKRAGHDDLTLEQARLWREQGERLRAYAEACEKALLAIADDGWLAHGSEGMSEAQELCYAIVKPLAERRAAGDKALEIGSSVWFSRSEGNDWEPWGAESAPKPPTPDELAALEIRDGRAVLGGMHFHAIRYGDGNSTRVWDAINGWRLSAAPEPPPAQPEGPVLWVRMRHGKPDWAEDVVSADEQSLRSGIPSIYADEYSVIPLYAHPADSCHAQGRSDDGAPGCDRCPNNPENYPPKEEASCQDQVNR